jgi:hypothetical protein
MSQPPIQPYPGSPQPEQQPYQPPQQPYPAPQQYPGTQPYSGSPPQHYPGQAQPPPYQGQPYQGQAYPGQPVAYGQPVGYPPPAPPAPPKKSKAGKIVLIALAAVIVLCGGGIAVAYVALKDDAEGIIEASRTRLVAPETLSGRPKVTDPELVSAANTMVASMQDVLPGATSTVGAFYGDPAQSDIVMIAGASGRVDDPEKELEEAIEGMGGASGLTIGEMTSVEPGPLGGVAKCGDATAASNIDMGLCVWADNGSVGVIVIYFKSGADVEDEFVTLRGQIEQRS